TKLYKPGQLNGYTYCIRQIFEENTLGYTHGSGNVTKLNNKCHNFSSEDQNGHLTGPSHPARLYGHPSETPSGGRKEQRRLRKEKAALALPSEGKLKFADRLRALLKRESHLSGQLPGGLPQDPYAFSEAPAAATPPAGNAAPKANPVTAPAVPPDPHRSLENGASADFFTNHRPHPQLQQLQQPQQHVQQQQQQHIQQHGPQSIPVKTFGSVEGKPKVVPVAAIAGGASVSGGCGVAGAPKLSKTMNRLQAKIAQNKLLDKLKKAQQDSCCSSSHNQQQQRVSTASASFVREVGLCVVKQEPGQARATAARERAPRPRAKGSSTSAAPPVAATAPPVALSPSAALRNLRQVWALEKAGLEAEDGAAAGRPHGALALGAHGNTPNEGVQGDMGWSSFESREATSKLNFDHRLTDMEHTRGRQRLRVKDWLERRKQNEGWSGKEVSSFPLQPSLCFLLSSLSFALNLSPTISRHSATGSTASTAADPYLRVPSEECFPISKHTHHTSYTLRRRLFECDIIFLVCWQHATPCNRHCLAPPHCVQDNYNKMASEPKPKKPRKKSKPPALTRPPKRGKKKSKQRPPGCSPFPYLGPEASPSSSLCLQQQQQQQQQQHHHHHHHHQRPLSPASSPSSSSSPCSSRSPPFLGSYEAAHTQSSMADVKPLLLQDLLPHPHERLHVQQQPQPQPKPHPQLHLPHLQLHPRAAGLGLVVRVKTEPKSVATAAATTTAAMTTQVHVAAPHSATPHLTVVPSHVASTPEVLPLDASSLHSTPPATIADTVRSKESTECAATFPSPKPLPTKIYPTTRGPAVYLRVHTVTPSRASPGSTVACSVLLVPAAVAVAAATTLSSTPLGPSPAVENYGYVAPPSTGMNPETTTKELVERIEPDLTSDLENQFSPDTIEKSLELPLDAAELANQATKLLEEHDFTEVLNKISDDAFSDFFAESKNGEYVPSKEETEELERALAAVSKDVHLARESLAKLSGATSSGEVPDLPDLVDAFPDLPLSSSDLTSLTQALMGNTPEALRTVALLSSDLHASASSPHHPEGFALLEGQQQSASTGGTAEVAANWLLGTVGQDFGGTGVGGAMGATATPAGASGTSQVGLPKQSVLAQESVS
ncbi:unnamed protein product, partial [Ixodes hexagonus]